MVIVIPPGIQPNMPQTGGLLRKVMLELCVSLTLMVRLASSISSKLPVKLKLALALTAVVKVCGELLEETCVVAAWAVELSKNASIKLEMRVVCTYRRFIINDPYPCSGYINLLFK